MDLCETGCRDELSAGSETGFSSVACTNLLLGLEIRVCADTLCVCMYRCVCVDIIVCVQMNCGLSLFAARV